MKLGHLNEKAEFAKEWYRDNLNAERKTIKDEIEGFAIKKNESERLQFILKKIREHQDNSEVIHRRATYLYCMAALSHHRKHGGMNLNQIFSLKEMIYAILKTQSIPTGNRNGAKLYGDLHLLLGQIFRKEGMHWRSIWEHHLANYVSGLSVGPGGAFNDVAAASRLQRLGSIRLSFNTSVDAYKKANTEDEKNTCLVEMARCLRMAHKYEDAERLLATIKSKPTLRDDLQNEAEWQMVCLEAQKTQDLYPMLKLTKKGEKHFNKDYVLETFLWTKCMAATKWNNLIYKIEPLARRSELKISKSDFLYSFCLCIEQCYDTEIPLQLRIENLGNFLERRNNFILLDYELLVLAAATRFLSRIKSDQLVALVFEEYRALSFRLSEGKVKDSLGCLGDLESRHWFANDMYDLKELGIVEDLAA